MPDLHTGLHQMEVLSFLGLMLQYRNGLKRPQSSIHSPLPSILRATGRLRELYRLPRRLLATLRMTVNLYRV